MRDRLLVTVLVCSLGLGTLFAAEDRPKVYFAVTRVADEESKEDSWMAMSGPLPRTGELPYSWYWYPRFGKPFFAVVTPVTTSEVAVFGVKFYWEIKDAEPNPERLQYVTANWDTPTPFIFEGRHFVLFASLKSAEFVKEKTRLKPTASSPP